LKTYTINNTTGELGPSGTTTLMATDSLKITTGYFCGEAAMCRVGSSDYYAILSNATASNVWKIRTIDINSTTGAIGNAWIDSLTICTKQAHVGLAGVHSRIERMGTVNAYYLIQVDHQAGVYFGTVGISAADGSIDNALIDSWDNTTNVSCSSPFVAVGGDIYAFTSTGVGSDGYLRTIEVDDTTALFIPTGAKDYRNEFEFNPVYSLPYYALGKISSVSSTNYQTSYILYEHRDTNAKLWLMSGSVIGELDEYGWAHKIWNVTFGKLWGIARSAVKKVFGL